MKKIKVENTAVCYHLCIHAHIHIYTLSCKCTECFYRNIYKKKQVTGSLLGGDQVASYWIVEGRLIFYLKSLCYFLNFIICACIACVYHFLKESQINIVPLIFFTPRENFNFTADVQMKDIKIEHSQVTSTLTTK